VLRQGDDPGGDKERERMNPRVDVRPDRTHLIANLHAVRGTTAEGPPSSDAARRGRRPPSAKRQILLVEDDRGIRDTLQETLEDEGYAVATAENGRDALEALRGGARPDLIVLDLRMPVMDGWQFRAAQKSDAAIAGIPVLAISADGSAKAEAIDAQAYLRKPLSTDALLETVGRIIADVEREALLGRLEEAERFAALGRLAASVGHEINNPLAYVSMNVELTTNELASLAHRPAAPIDLDGLLAMLRECRVGLDRIRDVVRDLQRLSRTSQPRREPFSMNELLDETLAMARNHVEHRATVRKVYGQLPATVGDRSALGQVLLNLVLNAAQALPEGRADANEIALTTFTAGGEITVEIRDSGAGIAPDVLPHIFDPFYTTKRIGEGTGLGLAVSCRIVADHGGRIDVASELGHGSAFRVVLPLVELAPGAEPELAAGDTTPRPLIRPARARVLVIDDVLAVGQTVAAALTEEYDVTVVTRASDAFARLAAGETFDVILCDLLMPKIGGREVFERLTAEWPHAAPNVVFMTGGAFTPESREFLERSGQRLLAKPFRIDDLRAVVRAQLGERGRGRN
jgi:signal transduction histidine kinase